MKRTIILTTILFVLPSLLWAGNIKPIQLQTGQVAPSFALPAMNDEYVSLREFCGDKLKKPWKNKTKHVVVLSFFATWCKPCMAEIPHLEKLYSEFKNKDIRFYLINVGENKEKVDKFVDQKKIKIPVLLDRYQKTAEKYDALALPRMFVLDKFGIIKKQAKGFKDPQNFEKEMRNLLNELLSAAD